MRGELAEGEPSAWLCLLDRRGVRLRGRKLLKTRSHHSWQLGEVKKEGRRSSSLLRDGDGLDFWGGY